MTIDAISAYCRAHLDLTQVILPYKAVYYHSLPMCVINAVFSIGACYIFIGLRGLTKTSERFIPKSAKKA